MKKGLLFLLGLVCSTIFISPLFGFNPIVFFAVLGVAGLINGSHKNSYFAMGLIINNINSDLVFQKAKQLVVDALQLPPGQTVNDQMLTQATLRCEVSLNTTSTIFHIPVNSNDSITGSQQNVTERRLGIQDMFAVTDCAFFIGVAATPGTGNFQIFTYPSEKIFTGAGVQDSLLGMYSNAYMRLENNGQVVTPFWDIYRHLYVQNQQYNAVPYYAANTTGYVDSIDGATDGFAPVQPGWLFSGASNINMNIVLPSALPAVTANTRIIALFRGVLLQNLSGVR
jgi:hypothetical protein